VQSKPRAQWTLNFNFRSKQERGREFRGGATIGAGGGHAPPHHFLILVFLLYWFPHLPIHWSPTFKFVAPPLVEIKAFFIICSKVAFQVLFCLPFNISSSKYYISTVLLSEVFQVRNIYKYKINVHINLEKRLESLKIAHGCVCSGAANGLSVYWTWLLGWWWRLANHLSWIYTDH